jgi:hypothetical protein
LAITSSSATNVSSSSSSATNRGSISFGTFTRANVVCCVTGSRSRTARLSDRFEMYGKGRPRPTASGVSTGKIWRRKRSHIAWRCEPSSDSQPTIAMPCSDSAGRSAVATVAACRCESSPARSRIASIVSDGVRPSAPVFDRPASTWSCRPATRIMKNSSRFEVKIAANFSRSISGTDASSASSSTRSLKSSQLSSRLK